MTLTNERISFQRCDYCNKPVDKERIGFTVSQIPIKHFGIGGVFCSEKCRVSYERQEGLR